MTLLAAVECQLQRPDAVTRSRAHIAVLGFWTLLLGSRVGFSLRPLKPKTLRP